MKIIGIDPGFAKLGWVDIDFDGDNFDFIRGGVITTKASEKKRKILVGDDNMRRLDEIAKAFLDVIPFSEADVIASEAQSWPRNSSSCIKIAMFWGALGLICQIYKIPLLQVTPQSLKKGMTGRRAASKEEVLEAVCQTGGFERFIELVHDMNLDDRAHMADASGASICCVESNMVRAMVKAIKLKQPERRKVRR